MRRIVLALVLLLTVPAVAAAHVERPSYWPDPKPDCSVTPCAGGAVPKVRSLRSALNRKLPGDTRVVCQASSLRALKADIKRDRKLGYDIRPTDHRKLSAKSAKTLLILNQRLFKLCKYHEIQPAVDASHNNDRVVVMPGLYTEPTARAAPTYDHRCDAYRTNSDAGDPGALSFAYQYHCPNDQNLIAVIGHSPGPGSDPVPAKIDRHGIPNLGACIRCNFQIEGSGVSADDVVVDAGDASKGNGGPSGVGHKKDVGIRADRADGFVLRNLTVRHALEHDIYVVESDGYVLDKFKTFYAGEYGVLTFVEDHGLMQNCEAAGNGDSGLYPGAGAKTSAGRDTSVYPEFRYSQELRDCDSHHNAGGYSGTDGNGTYIHDNNFYENALGFTTDVFTAPGHPGFPQQGDLVEHNNFYSNNFNPFTADSDVKPLIPAPVGTGLWIAGGNDNMVRDNHFYDNWRRGAMLFAVPDATVCGPDPVGSGKTVTGCNVGSISTSYRNTFTQNKMGIAPDGSAKPNGVDFWWDSFASNSANCWFDNGKVTSSPASLPDCAGGTNPSLSMGLGDVVNEAELLGCFVPMTSDQLSGVNTGCTWTKTPAKPGSAKAAAAMSPATAKQLVDGFCATRASNPVCGGEVSATAARQQLSSPRGQSPTGALTTVVPGSRKLLGLYKCSDWQAAGASMRAAILRRLRLWVGGPVGGSVFMGFGTVLTDTDATTLFDENCAKPYASGMVLYKQYGMAAGFAGL